MGFSLAAEAAGRGATVTLITGPTHLKISHPAISRIDITSAAEMHEKCLALAPETDMVIMAAAVADYTPVSPAQMKIKKANSDLCLELKSTQDILMELGQNKLPGQLLVGFALETNDEIENARLKLIRKNLDYIVMNSLNEPGAGFSVSTNKVTILDKKGLVWDVPLKSKQEVARDILNVIVNSHANN
jgi:phosphopantothenoylcysteine decarboxylase/phosphopantothenate--cysteine ligase